MLRSWLSHQHALDAMTLAFCNVTLNMVLMHLDAMLLNFSCNFQHTLDASWCYAPDFLINTLLMLRPWLSTMSPWTRSWCILMLCSWISHVASHTLLMLRPWLSTMSLWTRSWCILMLCSRLSHVASNTLWMPRSWLSQVASNQHALDAS